MEYGLSDVEGSVEAVVYGTINRILIILKPEHLLDAFEELFLGSLELSILDDFLDLLSWRFRSTFLSNLLDFLGDLGMLLYNLLDLLNLLTRVIVRVVGVIVEPVIIIVPVWMSVVIDIIGGSIKKMTKFGIFVFMIKSSQRFTLNIFMISTMGRSVALLWQVFSWDGPLMLVSDDMVGILISEVTSALVMVALMAAPVVLFTIAIILVV